MIVIGFQDDIQQKLNNSTKIPTGFLFILCLILALGILSCRKEKDSVSPQIEIIQPYENEGFDVSDTLMVEATVADENKLTSIQVQLTDQEYIPKGQLVNIPVTGNPQHFTVEYPLNSQNLPAGDYYIQVRASDGVNAKLKYRTIKLSAEPQTLTGILLITSPGAGSFVLQQMNPFTQQILPVSSWPHLFSSSALSLQNNQLYVAGKGIGECYALDLEDYTLDFNLVEGGTPSLGYHEKLFAFGDRFYVGLTEGYVKGYNSIGLQQFIATMTAGRKPCLMDTHHGKYLIVAEEQRTGSGSWIASYLLASGTLWSDYKLPDGFEVTSMANLNSDEMLIAGNANGVGRMVVWNVEANALSTPWQAASGKVNAMVQISGSKFVLALDQSLVLFDAIQQTVVNFLPASQIRILCYDADSDVLLAAGSGAVVAYRLSDQTVAWQKTLTDSIHAMHLQY